MLTVKIWVCAPIEHAQTIIRSITAPVLFFERGHKTIIMERTIETKFWCYSQNNSGGYFVEDYERGVCEYVIIEAQNKEEAWSKLEKIGEDVDGFWAYCSCCGERWSDWMDEYDAKSEPMIYDTPINEAYKEMFRERCFVHYYDGTFKEFKFTELDGKK